MKRKSLIAAVMVLVLLCASSVCVALANGWCDHDNCSYQYEVRFSTESEVECSHGDASCTVTETYTWYDIWCPKCLEDIGYAEGRTWEHSGEQCENEPEEYIEHIEI